MSRKNEPFVPQTVSEIWDLLGSMMLGAPAFKDKTGYFPNRNIDSEFQELTDGFGSVRKKLGEDRYAKLVDLAGRARSHFEADQEDKTGDAMTGRRLLVEIEDVLREMRKPPVKNAA